MSAKKPKSNAGRPSLYDEEFHPDEIIKLMNAGLTVPEICRNWGIHRDTLYEWAKKHQKFSDAFKIARQGLEASFVELFRDLSTGKIKGSAAAAIFLSKNVVHWTERMVMTTEDSEVTFDTGDEN